MSHKVYSNAANARTRAKVTPQNQMIPGREADQVRNSAGGVSFAVDMWTQFDRFLVLGSEGGSYYASEQKLTKENATNVINCIKADGVRAVNRIVEISVSGRAPKNDPALFALALAMTHGDEAGKNAAYAAIPEVARIGTHLFHLAEMVNGMRGWGRGMRNGFAAWYNGKKPLDLAMQMVKYAQRDSWAHRDVLRLAHVRPISPDHDALFTHAVGKAKELEISEELANFMSAVDEIKAETNAQKVAQLITDFKLPREVVPTQMLNEKIVWEALLPHMGITALVRNLATLTRIGIIGGAFSTGTKLICEKMGDETTVKKSRIHPLQVLVALNTYGRGHGVRGGNSWIPEQKIMNALDEMFYMSFHNLVPTGKNILLALDVSGSMSWSEIAGMTGITPRVGAAAMAMITARTEENYELVAFSTQLQRINITPKMRLDEVHAVIDRIPMGGTDCALPMSWADRNKLKVDGFAVYTDSETWAGTIHPSQALRQYRGNSGIPARFVCVGMVANDVSIADPNDAGMMDVTGFDTAAPSLIADFFRGEL